MTPYETKKMEILDTYFKDCREIVLAWPKGEKDQTQAKITAILIFNKLGETNRKMTELQMEYETNYNKEPK